MKFLQDTQYPRCSNGKEAHEQQYKHPSWLEPRNHRNHEVKRLEEERRKLNTMREEFDRFMHELRRAKDKDEFDRFMSERGRRDSTGFDNAEPAGAST